MVLLGQNLAVLGADNNTITCPEIGEVKQAESARYYGVRWSSQPALRLLVFAAAVGTCLWATDAAAGEITVQAPAGWDVDAQAPREALREADEWASTAQLEVTQVASPSDEDAFIENLVVLRDLRPLHPAVLDDEAASLATLADLSSSIFDSSADPESAEFVDSGSSRLFTARWIVDGVTWDVALAPSSTEHALIVLKTRRADKSLYDDLFDEVVASTQGVEPPIKPFAQATWRWTFLLVWLVLAGVAHGVSLALGSAYRAHLAASRRASTALIGLAIVVAVIVYLVLGGRAVSLELAGTSAMAVAVETLAGGLAAAGLLILLGRVLGGDEGRVESAPKTGVFSTDTAPRPTPASPSSPNAISNPSSNPSGPAAASPVPRQLGPDADADLSDFHRSSDGD